MIHTVPPPRVKGKLAAVFKNILKAHLWESTELVEVELMLCLDEASISPFYISSPQRPSTKGSSVHTPVTPAAFVTAGQGEMRPLWRGQQGPCPGH